MIRIIIALLISGVCATLACAQDSTRVPKISFDVSGFHIIQLGERYGSVLNTDVVPNYGSEVPYGFGPFGRPQYSYATDAPVNHGAQFIELEANAALLPNIRFRADLIAEHRGSSYGTYSVKNIIVYPLFHFWFDTSAKIFGEQFTFRNELGTFNNYRALSGLLLYNIDGTGTRSSIGWKSLHVNYDHLGDLLEGMGLNSDDAHDFSISLNDIELAPQVKTSLQGGYFIYNNYWHKQGWIVRTFDTVVRGDTQTRFSSIASELPFVMANTGWSLASTFTIDSLRLYSEYRYRNALTEIGSLHSKSAFLLGVSDALSLKNFDLQASLEYRFYGKLFNENYINEDVRYRPAIYADYGETIGPYLYPLTGFLRPFSQWAVFTEYQGRDVEGISLFVRLKYFFYDRFAINALLDANRIHASNSVASYFPFYDIGVSWEPIKNTGLFASLTNRAMNLDKHYPTLYLLSSPALQLEARFNFDISKH